MADPDESAKQKVRELIGQYFYGIDSGDSGLILSCFLDEAVYEFTVEQIVLRGRAEISRIVGAPKAPVDARAKPQLTSHVVSSQAISVGADIASADTFAVAYLVNGVAGEDRVLVRGLRYRDDVRLTEMGWRIARRTHTSLWQFEADSVSPDMRALHKGFAAANKPRADDGAE